MSYREDTDDPREIKAGNLKWLDRVVYRNLGSLQADLSDTEREMLVNQLSISLDRYETFVLRIPAVRQALYLKYNELVKSNAATSQLARDFNMSVKGHNRKVRDRVDSAFDLAHTYEREGNTKKAMRYLRLAYLSYRVLLHPDVVAIVERYPYGREARTELLKIRQHRRVLIRSIVKLAVSVAKKHDRRLKGNTVEWSDLAQEAVIAASDAMEQYRPIDGGKTLTSFINASVSGAVSKKVNETTRTVPIPRSMIDRYEYVNKAADRLGMLISDLRGYVHGDVQLFEGKVNHEILSRLAYCATALQWETRKNGKPFTPKEVLHLLTTTQDAVSTDLEVETGGDGDDGAENYTFVELLRDEDLTAEEHFDGVRIGERLMRIVKRFASEEEYEVMHLRYGGKEQVGYERLPDLYIARTGRPMNKCRARDIDLAVLDRIKSALERDGSLRRQFAEIEATLPYQDKL